MLLRKLLYVKCVYVLSFCMSSCVKFVCVCVKLCVCVSSCVKFVCVCEVMCVCVCVMYVMLSLCV